MATRDQIPFFETSAKTGENVEEMFQALGSLVIYGEPFYQILVKILSQQRDDDQFELLVSKTNKIEHKSLWPEKEREEIIFEESKFS